MLKITKREICNIMKNINIPLESMYERNAIEVYHNHEWDHGYDGYTGFCGTRRQFYVDFFEMKKFFTQYIERRNIQNVIIAPLHLKYYFNNVDDSASDIYNEICVYLKNNGINKNYESGLQIEIEKNENIIDAICEGAYRNISNICFLFKEADVIFEPHYHMNFYIYSNNLQEELLEVKGIIKQTNNIKLYINKNYC